MPLKLYLGRDQDRPHLREAHNDGGLILAGTDTQGTIPLVSFEVSLKIVTKTIILRACLKH